MFQIGEFSKIAQVSASLLRHYDKIGLFSPEYTDRDSGYRFYSAQQLPILNRIIALKELGLTLDQIATLIKEDLPASEIKGMLSLRKAQIEQQLREDVFRLKTIEARLKHIDTQGEMRNFDVIKKYIPPTYFFSLRTVLPDIWDGLEYCLEMKSFLPEKIDQLGNFMAILHDDIFETKNVDSELGFTLKKQEKSLALPSSGLELVCQELPEIELAATATRRGEYQLGHLTYGAIGTWCENNGYRFAGPAREFFFNFPDPEHQEETVMEVQIPIAKVKE